MAKLHVIETSHVPAALTPEDLRQLLGDDGDWVDMLVIGYNTDGELRQRSTRMSNTAALMLVEQFKARLMARTGAVWEAETA